ncbi:MAG: AzlC family ABC transporter permease [Treponema sp.]|jgi:4-azaleucine resistance transporter AzlC|nr:AzlC family ABC transporter permease [Treponema sp.]
MNNSGAHLLKAALKYSFPVFLGYLTIGIAFGLVVVEAGFPWWIALLTSVVMYAGAGQFIAIGLFASGAGLPACMLIQLVVNARHMAYGLTMRKQFANAGPLKWYLIFSLSDETFALLSSMNDDIASREKRPRFLALVSLLDQLYWIAGSLTGALAGRLIPYTTEGVGFALTALFVVLMIEQMLRVKKPALFIIPAFAAVLCVIVLPSGLSLLAAMAFSLAAIQFFHLDAEKKDGAHAWH